MKIKVSKAIILLETFFRGLCRKITNNECEVVNLKLDKYLLHNLYDFLNFQEASEFLTKLAHPKPDPNF